MVVGGGVPAPGPGPSPGGGTCGNGSPGDGVCADGTCCSQFGWCGTSAEHCVVVVVVVVVAVAVSRFLVPVLPQVEELAAMDLLVMEFVQMAPVAPSLAGVEPALNIAVVDNCNIFLSHPLRQAKGNLVICFNLNPRRHPDSVHQYICWRFSHNLASRGPLFRRS